MSEPRALVEHFFRHEFGRLVAVLTRSLGVRRLELAEDVVQAALMQALQTWPGRGVPEDVPGVFDDGVLDPDAVASVRIVHGGSGASTCALYLTKWIEQGLPGARVMVESASDEPGIRAITLLGGSAEVSIRRTGPSCVEARAGGRSYRTPLPPVTEEALMREELSILGPDSVFDRVLA